MKNKQQTNTFMLTATTFSLLASSCAFADFGVSAGGLKTQHYKDLDDKSVLFLSPEYRGDKFNFSGKDGISYDFTNSNKFAVEALLASKNNGYKAKDSKSFKGMDKRRPSIDVGGRLIAETPIGPAVFDATKDVYKSKGYEVGLKLGGIAPHAAHWSGKGQIIVKPAVGVRYQSAKMADYYYGVKRNEATAARKAYKAKSAVTPFVGLEAQANISRRFSINAGVGVSKNAKSIRNSPLTSNKKYDVGANIGFTYWF